MGLETGSFLNDLVVTNPDGADPKSEGDNHLRLIKTLLKATFPGMAGAAWRVQAKSAGYTVVANDNMSIFNCTSALTLSGTAAATLGNQHMVLVIANGGDVVFDPSGAETVNGAATLTIANGSSALITCNGSAFLAIPFIGLAVANIWTAVQTIRVAGGLRVEQASTQDAIAIVGRAGGTGSYEVTVTPTTLTADRTATLPDASITVAGVNAAQNFTAMQRAGVVSDNDGQFDLTSAAGNDFTWTPTGADVLDFSNEIIGARGCILLNNASAYAITLGSEVDADADCAATLSTAGKYWINYWCYDGTNVAVTYSAALV